MVISENTVRQRGGGGGCSTPSRRRAYSWRGESPPYEKLKVEEEASKIIPAKLLPLISQEARSVSVWLVSAGFIQVVVSILIRMASYAYPLKSWSHSIAEPFSAWWHESVMVVPSVIAGCLLRVVPHQVVSDTAPGFIYASAWYVRT